MARPTRDALEADAYWSHPEKALAILASGQNPDGSAYAMPEQVLVAQFHENVAVLAGGATGNGAARDAGDASAAGGGPGWARFRVLVSADQAGTVAVEQSRDGATWFRTLSQAFAANAPTIIESMVVLRYARAVVVNGAAAQGTLELDSLFLAA